MKNSMEGLALLIVSQCKTDFPKFSCDDASDLQSRDNQIGIEATEAIYEKKLDKIMSYCQKGFEKLGLIIICSDSLIPVKKETMEKV